MVAAPLRQFADGGGVLVHVGQNLVPVALFSGTGITQLVQRASLSWLKTMSVETMSPAALRPVVQTLPGPLVATPLLRCLDAVLWAVRILGAFSRAK